MIERIYRVVSSQTNVKGVSVKNKNKNKEYFLDPSVGDVVIT